jgi:hypothetical protein
MNKIDMLNELYALMPELKNYSFKFLYFLIYNNRKSTNRYTHSMLIEYTGMSSSMIQLATEQLEDLNVLVKESVGDKNIAPDFKIFPDNYQRRVEC